MLLSPPQERPYTALKAALIKRTSDSEQLRLQKLLITEELGYRKPSQLLRRMQQLLGERVLEPSILRQLLVQRLPTNVQRILASTRDDMALTDLVALADRILDVSPSPPTIAALATPPATVAPPPPTIAATSDMRTVSNGSELQQLRAEVSKLTSLVASLTHQVRSGSRSRSRQCLTPRGGRTPPPQEQTRSLLVPCSLRRGST